MTLASTLDMSSGAALVVGGTTATDLDLSRTGQTTTVKGILQVDQALKMASTLDMTSGAALVVGGTTATDVDLSRTGQTTTVKGAFQVDQAATLVSTLAVQGATLTMATVASDFVLKDATSSALEVKDSTGNAYLTVDTHGTAGSRLVTANVPLAAAAGLAVTGTATIPVLSATTVSSMGGATHAAGSFLKMDSGNT